MRKHPGPVIACIEFRDAGELREALTIAAYQFDERNEEMGHCLRRERGMEVLACRRGGVPYIAVSRDDELLDGNVDLSRVDRDAMRLLVRRLSSGPVKGYQGVEPLLDDRHYNQVLRWPEIVGSNNAFVKRNLRLVGCEEMTALIRSRQLPMPCFLKTIKKGPNNQFTLRHVLTSEADLANFDRVEDALHVPEDLHPNALTYLFQMPDWYCPYRDSIERGKQHLGVLDGDFILSDVLAIERDNLVPGQEGAKREYRSFVINGKPVSWSRYVDYDVLPVPGEIIEFSQAFARTYQDKLPPLYVMDVAETDEGVQLVELNNVENSGRYLSNDPAAFFHALHQHYNKGKIFPYLQPVPVPAKPEPMAFDFSELKLSLD